MSPVTKENTTHEGGQTPEGGVIFSLSPLILKVKLDLAKVVTLSTGQAASAVKVMANSSKWAALLCKEFPQNNVAEQCFCAPKS